MVGIKNTFCHESLLLSSLKYDWHTLFWLQALIFYRYGSFPLSIGFLYLVLLSTRWKIVNNVAAAHLVWYRTVLSEYVLCFYVTSWPIIKYVLYTCMWSMTSAVSLLFSISMPHGTVKFWQKQYVIWVFSFFYEKFGFRLNSNLMCFLHNI